MQVVKLAVRREALAEVAPRAGERRRHDRRRGSKHRLGPRRPEVAPVQAAGRSSTDGIAPPLRAAASPTRRRTAVAQRVELGAPARRALASRRACARHRPTAASPATAQKSSPARWPATSSLSRGSDSGTSPSGSLMPRLAQPGERAVQARQQCARERAVAGAQHVLADRPERLAVAVELALAGDELAALALPRAEEPEVLARLGMQAGEVERLRHDRRVAQPEGVVAQLVDRLHPAAVGEPVARQQDVHEARVVGLLHAALGQLERHRAGEGRAPRPQQRRAVGEMRRGAQLGGGRRAGGDRRGGHPEVERAARARARAGRRTRRARRSSPGARRRRPRGAATRPSRPPARAGTSRGRRRRGRSSRRRSRSPSRARTAAPGCMTRPGSWGAIGRGKRKRRTPLAFSAPPE